MPKKQATPARTYETDYIERTLRIEHEGETQLLMRLSDLTHEVQTFLALHGLKSLMSRQDNVDSIAKKWHDLQQGEL